MKFVRIFGDEDCILATHFCNEELDEFSKIFDQWTDIEYLDTFFTSNYEDLCRSFWEGISIEQAIIETRTEAIKLRKHLKSIADKSHKERVELFTKLFQPLDRKQFNFSFLDKKKAYGKRKKTWLRIYALKAGEEIYIITGGAIKLTDNMVERNHTSNELKKLERCKRFILEEGIVDEEGLIELLEI